MPQLFVMLAPSVQEAVVGKLAELEPILIAETERIFDIEGEEDVTVTTINAIKVTGDADVQIEVRYTAGEKEYGRDEVFDPSPKQRDELRDALIEKAEMVLAGFIHSVSAWVIPFRETSFHFKVIE